MDLVYVCRDGENEELRYSIRSAVENLPHDNIWVVGGKPDWYSGNYIKVKQSFNKYENVRESLRTIANSDLISEDFVLMNDDFFIMKKVDDVKTYHAGTLAERIRDLRRRYGSSSYTVMLTTTFHYLKRHYRIGSPLNYALHVPFIMNREKLSQIIDLDLSWRVAYGNIYNVGGEEVIAKHGSNRDIKVYIKNDRFIGLDKNSISDTFLSTEDNSFLQVVEMLKERFPNASKYEVGSMGLEPMTDGL